MIYDKKIKYLDYCENGERIKGSGFAKWELRNGSLKMEITVTGLSYDKCVTLDVILLCRDREIAVGRIGIIEGRGQYFYLCQDAGNIADSGVGYDELRGIRIPLGENKEILCSLQPQKDIAGQKDFSRSAMSRNEEQFTEKVKEPDSLKERRVLSPWGVKKIEEEKGKRREDAASQTMTDERIMEKAAIEKVAMAEVTDKILVQETTAEKVLTAEGVMEEAALQELETEEVRLAEKKQEKESFWKGTEKDIDEELAGEASVIQSAARERRMDGDAARTRRAIYRKSSGGAGEKLTSQKEGKWDQLWAIYPHIRPFRDKREYLSIGPSDFVIFPAASYPMANNSFLLHGYYNYHHLLLAKVESRGEAYYYIGVPGNYYEREKQVAIMFGFESFECAEEPAQAGDFGYYMMRTEL